MPSVILYCQHADCGKPFPNIHGYVPPLCPACTRPAKWHTTPLVEFALKLTRDDRAFLKALKIAP